jgi:hypothetical protein
MPSSQYYRVQAKVLLMLMLAMRDSKRAKRVEAKAREYLAQAQLPEEDSHELNALLEEFNNSQLRKSGMRKGGLTGPPSPLGGYPGFNPAPDSCMFRNLPRCESRLSGFYAMLSIPYLGDQPSCAASMKCGLWMNRFKSAVMLERAELLRGATVAGNACRRRRTDNRRTDDGITTDRTARRRTKGTSASVLCAE